MYSLPVSKRVFRQHIREISILGSLYSADQKYFIYNNKIKVNLNTIKQINNWQSQAENILTRLVNKFYYNKNIFHKNKIISIDNCYKEIYPELTLRLNNEIIETLWLNYLFSKIQKQFLEKNKKPDSLLSRILHSLHIY